MAFVQLTQKRIRRSIAVLSGLVDTVDHRRAFQRRVKEPNLTALREQINAAKQGDTEARLSICAALAWVAYACPAATASVYDIICDTWCDDSAAAEPGVIPDLEAAPIPDEFWPVFWQVIDGPPEGYDALTITQAVASLGGAVDPAFGELAEDCAVSHPGAANAQDREIPGMTDIQSLADYAEGTLGKTLYRMLIDNGYDPEVLDRDAIQLSELPPALRYLNTRILQMHDVWHLVAGYKTTGIQEIAISAFQLAQFGHNYSSMFLAVVMNIAQEKNPSGFNLLMQIISEAWRHGRATPTMMAIDWEQEWALSIAEIRLKHGISPIQSRLPDDVFETFQSGTIWKKLKLGLELYRFNRSLRVSASG